jgi:DNA-directed RNA polymerase specialized sigma24 family protein
VVEANEIERVYRERYGAFLRVAVVILRDEQLGEEAVHDAFVRALRHRRGFRGRGSLEGWLFRIVVNESCRRQAVERRPSPALAPRDPASTNGHLESARPRSA